VRRTKIVCTLGPASQGRAELDRLVAAGLERAKRFTWADTARRTLAVYRELL